MSVCGNLSKKLEISATSPASRDHYSWTIYRMRVCKYSLERCPSYLQLLCSMFFPESVSFEVSMSFSDNRTLRTDSVQKCKIEQKNYAALKFSPNLNRIMGRTSFWPNCHGSSVRKLILACLRHQTCFQLSAEIRIPCCFRIVIALVPLNQVSHVRMHLKAEKVIYNDIVESFWRFHFYWGQKLSFLRLLKSAQHRNFSSPSNFKIE
jgi:hypothetical protein